MRFALLWLMLLLASVMSVGSGNDTNHRHSVFWNSTNSIFDANNNDHIITVNNGDYVEIICPYYSRMGGSVSPANYEYYLIYMVDRESYDRCTIANEPYMANHSKFLVMNCSQPTQYNYKRTIPIFHLQSVPDLPDYPIGDFYFISTSKGHKSMIGNQREGACTEHGMKMVWQVRERTTEVPTGNTGDRTTRTTRRVINTEAPVVTQPPVPSIPQTPRPTTPTTTTTTTTQPTTKIPRPNKPDPLCQPGPCFPSDSNTVIDTEHGNKGVIEVGGSTNSSSSPHHTSLWFLHLLTAIFVLLLNNFRLRVCR